MASTISPSQEEIIINSSVDRIEPIGTPDTDDAPKLKRRQRLLQNLQRISSSSTLSLGRKRASSSPYAGTSRSRGSTFSLLTPGGSSSFSRIFHGQNASAPGSGNGTPIVTPMPVTPSPLNTVQNTNTSRPHTANIDDARKRSSSTLQSAGPVSTKDYFSHVHSKPATQPGIQSQDFNFWKDMPQELKLCIFSYLRPKELVRASIVNHDFHRICFDGQLWTSFDATEFYSEIPAASLANIIEAAGPFVKNLNLRGCVQVEHYNRADTVAKSCKNLMKATLEGCRNFQRSTLHTLLSTNQRLTHLNLTGLVAVNNGSCKIISRSCPQLESFNVSWCSHMDARGISMVLSGCPKLKDLRVAEIRGFAGPVGLDVATKIFETNNLERFVLAGCSDVTDEILTMMMHGEDPEMDILTDRMLVAPRVLRHLDLARCARITDSGLEVLAHSVPYLEGLQVGGCNLLTDASLAKIISTMPFLTHLDLEELSEITNVFLSEHLAKAPCASRLEHLSISYCESLGDVGMLPIMRNCVSLHSVEMDNTRVSDLVLTEAAAMVRARSARNPYHYTHPQITLRMVVFDCGNVTWTGVREILSRNAEIKRITYASGPNPTTFPKEAIGMKCFYGWQMTADEHMKRVLKGDLASANRLERRWAEYMIANEEAGALGAGVRRRRRRAREAAMLHADEEGAAGPGGIGRRRRSRSNGCAVM